MEINIVYNSYGSIESENAVVLKNTGCPFSEFRDRPLNSLGPGLLTQLIHIDISQHRWCFAITIDINSTVELGDLLINLEV